MLRAVRRASASFRGSTALEMPPMLRVFGDLGIGGDVGGEMDDLDVAGNGLEDLGKDGRPVEAAVDVLAHRVAVADLGLELGLAGLRGLGLRVEL